MSVDSRDDNYFDEDLYDDRTDLHDDEYTLESLSTEEMAATLQSGRVADYDDKYILKRLIEGLSREELALELDHKSYRTLDMYMRRRGYRWDGNKHIYVLKPDLNVVASPSPSTSKVERILSLFKAGIDPREIAKRAGMKDHRSMATYMKSKGYIWSSENQTYILLKGEIPIKNDVDSEENAVVDTATISALGSEKYVEETRGFSVEKSSKIERLEKLIPMLEMLDRNKDKLTQLLAINEGGTIPRYVVGGVTITKSLCMSHPLAELVKEFSKEKNISQKEIFEVAIIEFLKKYGYEHEVNSLFI